MQTPRLRDGDGRSTHVLHEEAMELPGTDSNARRQGFDAAVVERPVLDEAERSPHYGRRSHPRRSSWRSLGPASQTGAKAGLRRRGSSRVVTHVRLLGARRGADRPAIDAGRGHRDEEPSIEARIAAGPRAIERTAIESQDFFHA